MQKEELAEHLKQYHMGEQNAVTSRALALEAAMSSRALRNSVNELRQDCVPIGSSGEGYFYTETEQEVRATINHMTHRISGIAAAIRGLTKTLEEYDSEQTRLPLEGGGPL